MKLLVTGGSGFIGTNLIDRLLAEGVPHLNLDIAEPKTPSHRRCWRAVDILDASAVGAELRSFAPDALLHLAARPDIAGATLDEYKANTDGTANVLAAVHQTATIDRVIVTSSQYVNQDGQPAHDEDYAPRTVYGESKVITEQLTRRAGLRCTWTIIRPTNVWGPWHTRYPFEFWRVLSRGWYVHPGRRKVVRSYGYVGNVVDQILGLLGAERSCVHGRVFYVGDPPIDLFEWVNGFSLNLTGHTVRIVPRPLVKALAVVGEAFAACGATFPITLARYRSMTTSNSAPMSATYELLGLPSRSLEEGIALTTRWLREYHPALVRLPVPSAPEQI